jgi:hypothetical protein
MSDTQQRSSYSDNYADDGTTSVQQPEPTAWVGMVIFAGTMLLMMGALQAMEGLVAIFQDEYYLVTRKGMIVSLDYTAWGWTHLVIGLIAVGVGIGVFAGQTWARVAGIVIAAISLLVNVAFLPAYPIWIMIVIGIDVLAIYALAVHGKEMKYRQRY